jgi:MoxR-like ATPase
MAKCLCQQCSQHIEFPEDMAGQEIQCPACGSRTKLAEPAPVEVKIPKPAADWGSGLEGERTQVARVAEGVLENVENVILGKRDEVTLALAAFLAEGHVLLEDVPGVAKTMLARALAQSIGGSFKRVQCTPDLLPNDVTGASIFNQKTTEFVFRPGPIFAQVVLADEINRATPRTQSALLEAMAERQVTVDGEKYALEPPFFIIATQNPVDHEGTFPLPEAQLDRFLIRLSLGYPNWEEEQEMLQRLQHRHPIDRLEAVTSPEEVQSCQQAVREVHLDEKVREYLLRIVRATREHPDIILGGSPRATLALFRTSQALAAIRGHGFLLPDDVKEAVMPVMAHRLIVRPESRLRKVTPRGVMEEILNQIPVPTLSTLRGSRL